MKKKRAMEFAKDVIPESALIKIRVEGVKTKLGVDNEEKDLSHRQLNHRAR